MRFVKKIIFLFPTNRSKLLVEVGERMSPDNGLYGLNYLSKFSYETSFVDISLKWQRFLDIVFWPFDRIYRSQIDIGFQLGRALLSLPNINRADVVITNTDSIGLPICLLKRLGLINPPIVYAVGLFYIQGNLKKAVDNGENTLFRWFYKWVLGAADHIIYHSPIEKEKLIRLGLYNPAYCTFVAMGSDGDFFRKAIKRSDLARQGQTLRDKYLVLAVGRDHARDYKTLFEAARKLTQYRFVVLCSQRNIEKLEIPKNVETYLDVSYLEVKKWYQKANLVVIPMREMWRSSGQMTLTDSFQAGKAIVASNVVGIFHYQLINKSDALLVSPKSLGELTEAIQLVLNNQLLKTKLEKSAVKLAQRFSTKNYAQNIFYAIDTVFDQIKLKPISALDLEFLRQLRNENRQYFLDSNYIAIPDQKKWFENYKKKDNDQMFVLAKGQERIGAGAIYNINNIYKSAEIGRLAIEHKYQGRGYGKILLREIEKIAFGELKLTQLKLEVLVGNRKAINVYLHEGFRQENTKDIGGKKVIKMIKSIDGQQE